LARGKLLKTIKKRIREETVARLEGIRKFYKKHPEQMFFDGIRQVLTTTDLKTIVDITTAIILTPIVKYIIDTTEELATIWKQYVYAIPPSGLLFLAPVSMYLASKKRVEKVEFGPEWFEWLGAFALSWIIVKHFGAILQTVGDITVGIKGILTGLLLK